MRVNIIPCRHTQKNNGAGWPRWLEKGVRENGDQAWVNYDIMPNFDVHAFWGIKSRIPKIALARGHNCLIVERAYLGNRFEWRAMGWNGLNGWADFVNDDVEPDRWERYWKKTMQPWREKKDGYALIIGQLPGDASLRGRDPYAWAEEVAQEAQSRYRSVYYRDHPDCASYGWGIPSAERLDGKLSDALDGAAVVITYNSNTAVEAVMAGVPAIAMDRGSMAWDVTSHSLKEPLYTGDREDWGRKLAYAQWLPSEIRRGDAWKHLKRKFDA